LFLTVLEAGKLKIKASTESTSGEDSLSGLWSVLREEQGSSLKPLYDVIDTIPEASVLVT
jgi:hypothetical protein